MGTSRSATELVGKLRKLPAVTKQAERSAVSSAAKATKGIMLATAASRGVTPGGRIAGKKWTVRYDFKSPTVALVRFTGPFHLVEGPTKPHQITARGAATGRRGRKGARALKMGDDFRASASHPGTRGKKVFATGKVVARHQVPRTMAAEFQSAWRGIF
jgi:hypothetical protein